MALTASAPTKPASAPEPTLEAVPTDRDAIRLVIAQKWGEKEYQTWRTAYDKAEAARRLEEKRAARTAVSVRVSRPDGKQRVGGRLVLSGGDVGQGSRYGVLTIPSEALLTLYEAATIKAVLDALETETKGVNPEVKVKTYGQGPKEGQTHEVWTVGDLELEDPTGFPARLEDAIKRLVPVGANGNGNGR